MEIARRLEMPEEAEAAFKRQRALAAEVVREGALEGARWIGAVDVAYAKGSDEAFAAVVVLDGATLEVVDRAGWSERQPGGYVPGLFALREAESLLKAFERLETRPDVVMVDGHGIAHPRRFGLACQLGLALDLPTVGCAKTRLCGEAGPLDDDAGARAPLVESGEQVGALLRTQGGIKPVYVSLGHRCSLDAALGLVMRVRGAYRIPEPLRQAHHLSVELRAGRSVASEAGVVDV